MRRKEDLPLSAPLLAPGFDGTDPFIHRAAPASESDGEEPTRVSLLLDEAVGEEVAPPLPKRPRRTYKPAAIVVSLTACLVVSLVPMWKAEEAATRASAKRGLALFVFAAVMYGTEALPAWVVSLAMFPLSTAIELPPKTSSLFVPSDSALERASLRAQFNLDGLADQVNFLVLGSLTLAAAMNKYSLDMRVATSVLSRAGRVGPRTLTFAVLAVGFFLSWVVGNACASVALLLIMTPLLRACPRDSNFPQLLASCIAFGGNLGGMATPTSSGQNAAALSILTGSAYQCRLGFGDWIAVTLPTIIVLMGLTWCMLYAYWRPTLVELPKVEIEELGPMNAESISVAVIVVLTVGAWASSSVLERFFGDLGIISTFPMVLLFGSGLLNKQDLLRLDWSLIILLGGGFCLGGAVEKSGALDLCAASLQNALSTASPELSAAVFNVVIASVSNFVSHSVTAVTLLPVIAQTVVGGPVAATVMSAVVADSGACLLPISSIPNLIISAATDEHGGTYLKIRNFLHLGSCFCLLTYALSSTVLFQLARFILRDSCPRDTGGLLPPPPLPPPGR